MSNLYEIEEELQQIYNELEVSEGLVDDELYAKLEITQEQFKDKVGNYAKFIRVLENKVNFAQTEIARIEKYISPKTNLINRLKGTLLDAVKRFGEKDPKKDIWRYEVDTFRLSTRSSKSVTILDEELIEDRFKEISISKLSLEDKVKILDVLGKSEDELKIKVDIPKTPIKEEIEAGHVVEGASLDTNYSLTLK